MDGEALDALMTEHGDRLYRLCFLYLRDAELAHDAVQDTFLKVWRHGNGFRGESREATWLSRVAINTCKDYRRSAWQRHVDRGTPLDCLPAPEGFPPENEALLEAVMALPDRDREAILLRYYENLPLREVARVLRVPTQTAASRIRRAVKRLRGELKEWYFDET